MADSQKFIARNRAPRVQIEYDVEVYGARKKIQLPFVIGVMSDLSGKSEAGQAPVEERTFLEFDAGNFDDRMKAMRPRAAFTVPNTLTGEGSLAVDLTFESMEDFSPAAVARRIEPLRKLLEARTQLDNLLTYMDGKAGAEALVEGLLANKAALAAILGGAGAAETGDVAQVLAALRAEAPAESPEPDAADDVLARMAAEAPETTPEEDAAAAVLAAMAETAPADDAAEAEAQDSVLEALAAEAQARSGEEADASSDASAGVLAAMAERASEVAPSDDGAEEVLADLARGHSEGEAPAEADETDAILADIAEAAPGSEEPSKDDPAADILADLAAAAPAADEPGPDEGADVLSAMAAAGAGTELDSSGEDHASVLEELADQSVEPDTGATEDDTARVLAGMAEEEPERETETGDERLADLADEEGTGAEGAFADAEEGAEGLAVASAEEPSAADLDALLGDGDSDLDALLAEDGEEEGEEADGLDALPGDDADDDLDALLADADSDLDDLLDDDGERGVTEADDLDDPFAEADDATGVTDDLDALSEDDADDELDALLGDEDTDLDALLAEDGEGDGEATDDLDALLDDDAGDDPDALLGDAEADLDALLDDAGGEGADDPDAQLAEDSAPAQAPRPPYNPAFGKITAPKPEIARGDRRKMRIAIMGDFSGRANRGALESGAALAARKPIRFDIDTLDDVIARFTTTLTLPLGRDGSAIEVELSDIDGLHPDELFENVELFSELRDLRMRIARGRDLDAVAAELRAWGEEFADFRLCAPRRGRGAAADARMRVSDFAALIGAEPAPAPEPTAAGEMIRKVVAPFVQAAPDAGQEALLAAVDRALSAAMSSILHHPDFQAVEANWRTLDMLARRIETGPHLELVLYDVAVEEFAADLAAHEDLAESALYDMLVERPRLSEDQGPLAAVFGLYTFEETPPHAELLARMSRICAHMDAPFVAAMGADFLKTKAEDLPPVVAKTWAAVRALPEARYIGLATPRFLLRMPYGRKTDPVEPFDYEEFNTREGMRSLLLGNPAALVAILLARTAAEQGAEVSLGSILSLDDMPFHYMTDRHGDQVALPSTERLLNERLAVETVQRGYMPVLSIQGQNVVRLGSFNALGGGELAGLWSGEERAALARARGPERTGVALGSGLAAAGGAEGGDAASAAEAEDPGVEAADALDLSFDDDDLGAVLGGDDEDAFDLSGLGDDSDEDDDIDDDLEALLADL